MMRPALPPAYILLSVDDLQAKQGIVLSHTPTMATLLMWFKGAIGADWFKLRLYSLYITKELQTRANCSVYLQL